MISFLASKARLSLAACAIPLGNNNHLTCKYLFFWGGGGFLALRVLLAVTAGGDFAFECLSYSPDAACKHFTVFFIFYGPRKCGGAH